MDDGQKTPRGHPDFNSYIKNIRVLVFQTDGWMDEQTETLIWCWLPSLRSPRGRWCNKTHKLCLKNWVEFMVEVQIRIFLVNKVEVQVRILLRDK
jgi:hypothetical protein